MQSESVCSDLAAIWRAREHASPACKVQLRPKEVPGLDLEPILLDRRQTNLCGEKLAQFSSNELNLQDKKRIADKLGIVTGARKPKLLHPPQQMPNEEFETVLIEPIEYDEES